MRMETEGWSTRNWRKSEKLSQKVSDPTCVGTAVARTSARSDQATSRPGDGVCRGLDEELLSKYVRAEEQAQSSGRRRRRAPPKRVDGGWWSTLSQPQRRRCLGMCTDHARCARQLIRTTVLPSLTHHHYVRTPRCLQLLLISLVRRARAAGLLLRLPASQVEQATARSAAAGHVGGREAAYRGRS